MPVASNTEAGLQSAENHRKVAELESRIETLETGRTDTGTHEEPAGTGAGQYLAAKATKPFAAADFLGSYGVAFEEGEHTASVPNIGAGNFWYIAVARLASSPAPTFFDIAHSGQNQFDDITLTEVARINLPDMGPEYRVWESVYRIGEAGDDVEFR